MAVELRTSAEAIPLAPLRVVSGRSEALLDARLDRWGYYDRKRMWGKSGVGQFLEHEEVMRRDSWNLIGACERFRV